MVVGMDICCWVRLAASTPSDHDVAVGISDQMLALLQEEVYSNKYQ